MRGSALKKRKDEKRPITTRLDSGTYSVIEQKVASGEFDSVSVFVRHAIEAHLKEDRILDRLNVMQQNLMAANLDVVAEVTGMTPEEKQQACQKLNEHYQDDIFE